VGGIEGAGPAGADIGGGAVVDRCRGVQSDAGVAVFVVVVGEEPLVARQMQRTGVPPGAWDHPRGC